LHAPISNVAQSGDDFWHTSHTIISTWGGGGSAGGTGVGAAMIAATISRASFVGRFGTDRLRRW
jgi:hypothetical protein